MFELKEKTKMVVIATTSGDEVGVYYRDPTTKEMHQYQNESVQRKRNKVVFRHSEAQLKFGNKILVGVKDGDFGAPDASGKMVAISSDPQSPQHREDWRELLLKHGSAIIMALGAHVFGGTEALDGEEDAEDIDDDEGEDVTQD